MSSSSSKSSLSCYLTAGASSSSSSTMSYGAPSFDFEAATGVYGGISPLTLALVPQIYGTIRLSERGG